MGRETPGPFGPARPHVGDRTISASKSTLAAVSAISAVAAVLRFFQIGKEGFWFDEIIMAQLVSMRWVELIGDMVSSGRPPLYVLLAKAWTDVFGTGEAAARSFSAVLGLMAVPALYLVAERLFERRVALLSALIMALSPFQVYYSQEFRYYSLVVLLSVLTMWFFVRALDSGRTLDFILFGVGGALLFYTHLLAVLLVAAADVYYLLRWKRTRSLFKGWLLSQALLALLVAPWFVPEFIRQVRSLIRPGEGTFAAGGWVPPPPLYAPLRTVLNFMVLGRRYVSLPILAAALGVLLVGVVVTVGVRGRRRRAQDVGAAPTDLRAFLRSRGDALLLVVLWLLIPIMAIFIPSLVLSPFYVDRYVITAAPALYMLAAVVIVQASRFVPEGFMVGALLIVFGGALTSYYVEDVKGQWREAAAYLEEHVAEGDVLAFTAESGSRGGAYDVQKATHWYYAGDAEECVLWRVREGPEVFAAEMAQCVDGARHLWLVLWEYEPDPVFVEDYFDGENDYGVRMVGREEFLGLTIFQFEVSPSEDGG